MADNCTRDLISERRRPRFPTDSQKLRPFPPPTSFQYLLSSFRTGAGLDWFLPSEILRVAFHTVRTLPVREQDKCRKAPTATDKPVTNRKIQKARHLTVGVWLKREVAYPLVYTSIECKLGTTESRRMLAGKPLAICWMSMRPAQLTFQQSYPGCSQRLTTFDRSAGRLRKSGGRAPRATNKTHGRPN